MSGFEEGGVILTGDMQLSIDVRADSIIFTNLNDASNPTFTVQKSMPEFIKYMQDSIRATATSMGRIPAQEIIDLHQSIPANPDELKTRYLGSGTLFQLCKLVPEHKIDETVTQLTRSVIDMEGDTKSLTISGITITEEGERKVDKILVFKDENNNELLNIPKKTFKELRQDLRMGIEELRLSGMSTGPQLDFLNLLNQKIEYNMNGVISRLKNGLNNFGEIDKSEVKAKTVAKESLSLVCPPTEFELNEKSASKNYSELPHWVELQTVFDTKKVFNDLEIILQLTEDEESKYRSGKQKEVKPVVGLVPNAELVTLKNDAFAYDRTGFNQVKDGKLIAYADPTRMEEFWVKSQLLVKSGQVHDIKFYFHDPDSPFGEKGKVAILFYVDNFHDRDELDRVRNLMIENDFINNDDDTPVFKTGVPNTVACRYPDLTITDEETFGKIINRPVVSTLQEYI